MHNQRIAFIILAGAGILATFLPYTKTFFASVSLMETTDGTGYVIIIAFAISLIVSLLGDQKEAIVKGHLFGVIIPGAIPGAVLLLFVLGRSTNDLVAAFTNFDIGFYFVLIASLSILFIGMLLNTQTLPKKNIPVKKHVNSIFCSNCGKEVKDETAAFCEECGAKL
jgi:hypothetical protein